MNSAEAWTVALRSPTLPLPPPLVFDPGARIERTIPPEEETLVTLAVPQAAACDLYHSDHPEHRLRLFADDQGVVRFHATAKLDAPPVELQLEYPEGGRGRRHPVSLTAGLQAGPATSTPELIAGTVRPPLAGDPLSPSIRELVAMGYPPRPDPSRYPRQYAHWRKEVARSRTVVSPRIMGRPDRTHSPGPDSLDPAWAGGVKANATANTWSGAYLTNPAGQFYDITASWTVPTSFSISGFAAMSAWVGLDNAANDLYQAGSGAECLYVPHFWNFSSYSMWMESLPGSAWTVPGFQVSPGDHILVDIWVANQYGETIFGYNENEDAFGLTSANNRVWFYLVSSNGSMFMGTYPTAPQAQGNQGETAGFSGKTAEFIVERPSLNNVPLPLAFFTPTIMHRCGFGDALYENGANFVLPSDNSQPVDGTLNYLTMVSNGITLDVVQVFPDPSEAPGANQMNFIWLAPD